MSNNKVEPLNTSIYDPKRPKGYIKEIIISSTFDTTTHGIDHIFKRDHPFIRVFWTFCFIVSIGVCAYMITISIMDYFNYETVTKAEHIYLVSTDFPAVSICNVNPFMTNVSVQFYQSILIENGLLDATNPTEFFNQMTAADLVFFWYFSGSNALNPNLTDAFRQSLGYRIDDMIFSCMYDLNKCTADDFIWFYDILYGNCFTFNSGKYSNGSIAPIRKSTKEGALNGLYLELFLYDQIGSTTLSVSNGIRIVVHNQTKTPSFYDGSLLSAGTQSFVEVQRVFSSHLEKPYSDCTKDITIDYPSKIVKSMFNAGYTYNQKDCFYACFQKYLIDKCGCYDFSIYSSVIQFMLQGTDLKPCLNLSQILCDIEEYSTFFSVDVTKICGSECPLECKSIKYNLYTSQADYPSQLYAKALLNNQYIRDRVDDPSNLTFDALKRKMLQFSVFYGDMGYQQYEEFEKTSISDLVASIGGTLGLFLGMSFLSFVEILDVFLQICFYKKSSSPDQNSA